MTLRAHMLGGAVRIDVEHADDRRQFAAWLAGFAAPSGDEPDAWTYRLQRRGAGWRLNADGATVDTTSLAGALDAIRRDVGSWAVARHGWLGLHAAALALDDGVVALVGPSCAGKTSLAAALLQRGAGYLSDETALIDDELYVHGFPFPARVRAHALERTVDLVDGLNASLELSAEVGDDPRALALPDGEFPRGGRLSAVLLLEPSDDVTELVEVPASERVRALAPNLLASHDASAFTALARVARDVPFSRLRWSTPHSAAELLLQVERAA